MASQTREEGEIRILVRRLKERGVVIRREKLSRGREFRVKSGTARVFGEKILFVDRALPEQQQLTILLDYILEHRILFTKEELSLLSPARRGFLAELTSENLASELPPVSELTDVDENLDEISTEISTEIAA